MGGASLEMPDSGGTGLAWWWTQTKDIVEHSVAFSNDALHVVVGVLLLLVAALALRRPVSSWAPWLVVLLFVLVNEASDLWIERWPQVGRQYGEGVKDIVLTMVLPTLLLLTSRRFPWLYEPRRASPPKKDSTEA